MTSSSDRWRRVEELCDRALALSPDERQAFLLGACAGDCEVLRDVESLLAHENHIDAFLRHSALVAAADSLIGDEACPASDANPTVTTPRRGTFAPDDLVSERFRIVNLLGGGGMGDVYEAEDLMLGGRIALKTLPAFVEDEERAVERLKREIAAARRVTHPNVCRVFDADHHDGSQGSITFFTMELLRGATLAEHLRQRGRLEVEEARALLKQMAASLDAAHAARIVHGDFKPGNVILVPSQQGGVRAVVTDFGLARQAPATVSDMSPNTTTVRFGTPAYMAPEHADGRTSASDIYALGIVAYEMITGEVPVGFQDSDLLDPRWRAAIRKCLDRDPEKRFKSAGSFVEALDASKGTLLGRPAWLAGVAGVVALLALSSQSVRMILLRASVATVTSTERIVAVLPFTMPSADPESQAYGRALAASIADDLRFASALERGRSRVLVIPAAEVLEADIQSAKDARRLFSANLLLTGRFDKGAIVVNAEEAGDGEAAPRTQSRILTSVAGSRVLDTAGLVDLAGLVGFMPSQQTQQRLKALDPATAEAKESYLRGKGFLTGPATNLDAAVRAFRRAIELDGAYAIAHAGLGDAYLRTYRVTLDATLIARAQSSADAAIAFGPTVAYAHVVRGRVYRALGQNERAVRELQTALEIDPAIVDARRFLAEAYEADGALQAAEEVYRQEIASYPHYFAPHVSYGSFLIKQGRYREAETSLVDGLRYAPDNSSAIGNLAGLYILTERLVAAESELKRGLALQPDVVVCNNLAWVQIYQGRFSEAVQFMEEAVRLPRADSFHWGNLARAYRWAGRLQQAQSTYQKGIELARQETNQNPSNARIRGNFAQMLAETGHAAEALVEIAATLERAPRDVSVLFRSALVNELAGNRAAALRALESSVRGGYSVVDIRRHPDLAPLREDPRFVDIITLTTKSAVH